MHVFERTGGTWTQRTTLLPDDAESGDGFGAAVAVVDDTIAVGAPVDRGPESDATGSAHVYEF